MDNRSEKRTLSIDSEILWKEKWFTVKVNKQAQYLICKSVNIYNSEKI